MGISEKIEEIKKKPEHVRMMYVWGCVIVSMAVIMTIWGFSIKANSSASRMKDSGSSDDLKSIVEQFGGGSSDIQPSSIGTPAKEEGGETGVGPEGFAETGSGLPGTGE